MTRPTLAPTRAGWRLFSPSAQQGLRAMLYLATRGRDQPVTSREIAAEEGIPRPFLAKLLLTLRNVGLVETIKGPGGGYRLPRPAGEIEVGTVIETFDGPLSGRSCVLGLDVCDDDHPCALHEYWKAMREQYMVAIAALSLEEAVEKLGPADRAEHQP